jgi:hypothetical protein
MHFGIFILYKLTQICGLVAVVAQASGIILSVDCTLVHFGNISSLRSDVLVDAIQLLFIIR